MRQSIFYGLMDRGFNELSRVIQLLGPSEVECPLCGKKIKSLSHPSASQGNTPYGDAPVTLSKAFRNAVCQSCFILIPWLTTIRCYVCGRGIECRDCARRTDSQFIANRSAVQYSSTMREWLAQYKYRGNERLEPLLAEMMIPTVLTLSNAVSLYSSESIIWDAITYVPVSPERAGERGFNQAERLAALLAQHFRIPLVHLLIRKRHTEKQSFKSRSERMQDTRSLFKAKPEAMAELYPPHKHHLPRKSRILLVDDIYTTGSTIQACASALNLQAQQSLDIYAITWARS